MRILLLMPIIGIFLLATPPVVAQDDMASDAEVREAYGVFLDWLNAYQAEQYHDQWQLTDRRIRNWWPRERWTDFMRASRRHTGELTSIEVLQAGPIEADTLPCTERGHCYRPGVRYVFLMFRTRYSDVEGELTEYAAMAESGEGWRFGGGNILNRPLGETSVIMTRTDESRYRQSFRQ